MSKRKNKICELCKGVIKNPKSSYQKYCDDCHINNKQMKGGNLVMETEKQDYNKKVQKQEQDDKKKQTSTSSKDFRLEKAKSVLTSLRNWKVSEEDIRPILSIAYKKAFD